MLTGVGVVLYRSGGLTLEPNDVKVDKNGYVTRQQGLSLNMDPAKLQARFPD